MTIIKIQKRDPGYAMIDNRVLADPRLTWKAKGILVYLLSKPNNWKVQVTDITNHSPDGECAVRTALDELLSLGYAERETIRRNGKFESWNYIIHEEPLRGFPQVDKPDMDNRPLNNKESTNKESTNKEKEKRSPQPIKEKVLFKEEVNNNRKEEEWFWLRHELKPLAQAFILATSPAMMPTKDERPLWQRETRKWLAIGATPALIQQAVKSLQRDRLTIGGPTAITKTLRSILTMSSRTDDEHPTYKSKEVK